MTFTDEEMITLLVALGEAKFTAQRVRPDSTEIEEIDALRQKIRNYMRFETVREG